jgi:hypothetical protein
VTAGAAQGVHPQCRTARDSRACTCAVTNGGSVSEDPHRPGRLKWRSPRLGTGAHMAFMNCTGARRGY